jgi:hypothetical protein
MQTIEYQIPTYKDKVGELDGYDGFCGPVTSVIEGVKSM